MSRALGLVLLLLTAPALAAAQSENAQSEDAQARRLFAEGTDALASGRFAEARDRFRRSLALTPNAGTAFNLAVALRGTGEVVESREVFDALLSDAHGPLRRAQRNEITELRDAVDAEVAVLTLEVSGAATYEVRVDAGASQSFSEHTLAEDATLELNPGSHTLSFTSPERASEERTLELARGQRQTLVLRLRTPPAVLVVEAAAADDRVAIESVGEAEGRLEREVEPGRYTLSVRRPSGGERQTSVTVSPGETLRVRLDVEASDFDPAPFLGVGIGALVLAGVGVLIGLLVWDPVQDPIADDPDRIVTTLRARF